MKIYTRAVLALAAALAVTAAIPAGPAYSAGKMSAVVIFVSGDVKVKHADDKDYSELKLNDALQPGDTILTGAGAKASLVSKGGAELRINENSTFSIPGKSKVREMFDLSVGQVWGRMLHKMAQLNVRTPSAVCAVRGTEADIEQKDTLTVKVYEGHVDLTNAQGKQSLHAGQISTVAGGAAAPTAPRQMTNSEMGKWQDSINVKDIGKYMEEVGLSGKENKKLKVQIEKDGKAKDVEIQLKKK